MAIAKGVIVAPDDVVYKLVPSNMGRMPAPIPSSVDDNMRVRFKSSVMCSRKNKYDSGWLSFPDKKMLCKDVEQRAKTVFCTAYINVLNNYQSNKPTYCLYLDYKKAFDTVSHSIILDKMRAFGLN